MIEIEEDLVVDSDDGESKKASSYVTENTEDSLTGVLDNRVSNDMARMQLITNIKGRQLK